MVRTPEYWAKRVCGCPGGQSSVIELFTRGFDAHAGRDVATTSSEALLCCWVERGRLHPGAKEEPAVTAPLALSIAWLGQYPLVRHCHRLARRGKLVWSSLSIDSAQHS